jgi:5-methylcytosine-specific restriction enzyme A
MVGSISTSELCIRLSAALGFDIESSQETVDGGVFDAFRVRGADVGPNYSILLARTPRQVEAIFRADNFAGQLIRCMSEASGGVREAFAAAIQDAKDIGLSVVLSVNNEDMSSMWASADGWRRVEIEFAGRIDRFGGVSEAEFACVSSCFAAVFALSSTDPDDYEEVPGVEEGASRQYLATRYERSPSNRLSCIRHYGARCYVCTMDYGRAYGALGDGYIEVHHIEPISRAGGPVLIDPIKDLVPLCASCHRMVHRSDPPMHPDDLRAHLSIMNQ